MEIRTCVNAFRSSVAVVVGIIATLSAAQAQEINYGALEQLFGQPVTTSATGSPQQASAVPANMQIISADQIRQSGATDIPDILRYIAGIDVRSYGALDSEVSIRGYSQIYNPRLLVLINGRQVYLDDYGIVAWQTLPVQLADIRQIEIVRGPASALFGFNAASGVINIITYDPLFDRTNVLDLGFGTDGTYQGSIVSTVNDPGKGGITVQIGGLKTDEYSTQGRPALQDPPHSHTELGNYAIDGRYKPTQKTEVTLEVTQSKADGLDFNASGFYFRTPFRNDSIKSSFAADSAIGIVTLLGYINQGKTAYLGAGAPLHLANQVGVLQLNDLFKPASDQEIRAGLEFRNNRETGTTVAGALLYNDYAASLMWNWQIMPVLAFTAAGRIDHMALQRTDPTASLSQFSAADYEHAASTTPTYNLGLVWQPTDSDTIRLLTGRAVRAPSLIELGAQVQLPLPGFGTALFAGNPFLKPSTSTSYEIDYDRQLAPAAVLRTAIFYSTTKDILASSFILPLMQRGDTLQVYSSNVGSSASFGGELGLHSDNAAGWRYDLSYSLVSVRDCVSCASSVTALSYDNSTPTSIIDFILGYSWNRWEADVSGHWQSNYADYRVMYPEISSEAVTIRNYITMSGRIGYQVNSHLTLSVAGQQLTGSQIVETAEIKPERRLLFSATFNY